MKRGKRAGFSLLEVLIAIALFAGFMAAATTILFQVSVAWSTQAEDPVADRHAEGLERFLRSVFAESGATGLEMPDMTQTKDEGAVLVVTPPADFPPVVSLAQAGGAVSGRLAMPRDGGLWLFWNTGNEKTQGMSEPHRTLLSPWVVATELYAYDENSQGWQNATPGEAESFAGGTADPSNSLRMLRVTIVHRGQTRVLQIPLPRNGQ